MYRYGIIERSMECEDEKSYEKSYGELIGNRSIDENKNSF